MVYVTCKDKKEAEKISKHLINKRLIACSNLFPIKSVYRWNKRIVNDNEYVLILKTKDTKLSLIKKEIIKIHSYGVPFIGKLNIDVNKEYERYLNKEVK